MPYFVFRMILNLSKSQWIQIFTKLGICIDIVEIWFGIANGQITSAFDRVVCPPYDNGGVLTFHILFVLTLSSDSCISKRTKCHQIYSMLCFSFSFNLAFFFSEFHFCEAVMYRFCFKTLEMP